MSTVMTVDCPSCASTFPVDPDKVPEGGCRTQCTTCEAYFDVDRPSDDLPLLEIGAPLFDDEMGVEDAVAVEDPVADEDAVTEESEVVPEAVEDLDVEGDWDALARGDLTESQPDVGEGIAPDDMDLDALGTAEPLEAMEAGDLQGDDDWGMDIEFEAEAPTEPEPEAEPEPAPEPPVGFQMGRRDPHEKARRLARVLVSDMITYNPDRHSRALEAGTLQEDFQEEIDKSWAEYVEQVGHELAESTSYWTDALNELLARGEPLF